MLGNVQNKLYKLFSPTEIIYFSVDQSIATHIFVNFVIGLTFVGVAFYFKWGFGRQRHGFESGSWFLRGVGLSPHLGFWGMWV